MKNLFVALALICAFNLSAQSARSVGSFDEIIISGKLDVLLEKGEEEKVYIYEEGRSEGEVNISTRGNTLKLSLLDGWLKADDRPIPVRVVYTDIRKVRCTAGAQVSSDEAISARHLELKAGSGAEVELKLEVKTLDANVSEGGIMKVFGSVDNQYVTANTGGQYEGEALDANSTYVKANTGGEAHVNAQELLEATANTGGEIRYSGNPVEKRVKSNLAGEIRRY